MEVFFFIFASSSPVQTACVCVVILFDLVLLAGRQRARGRERTNGCYMEKAVPYCAVHRSVSVFVNATKIF